VLCCIVLYCVVLRCVEASGGLTKLLAVTIAASHTAFACDAQDLILTSEKQPSR